MGYRMEYEGFVKEENPEKSREKIRCAMTLVFAVVFFLLVTLCWQEGREVLTGLFIPGNPAETLQAAQCFAENLRQGESFSRAAAAFCDRVLRGEAVR